MLTKSCSNFQKKRKCFLPVLTSKVGCIGNNDKIATQRIQGPVVWGTLLNNAIITYVHYFLFPSANLRCYFVGDEPLGDPNITKVLPTDEETTMLSWEHTQIVEIHRRRYMLKDNALEIFLMNGRTLLLAFTSTAVSMFLFSRVHIHQDSLSTSLPSNLHIPFLPLFSHAKHANNIKFFVFSRNGITYTPNSWNWIFPISMIVERMRMKNSNKSLRGMVHVNGLSGSRNS